ncbi:MAG TPA: hypothetical protein EYP62_02145 [Kiritimatiellae bacterium]|nr:hypothetical protein [Kiritimatiellia bacterium]
MNLRLDLLKDEEFRFPGRLSRPTMVKLGAGAAAALVAAVVVGLILQGRITRGRLQRVRASMKKIDASYQIVRGMQKDLMANRNLQNDLEGWSRARLSSAQLLRRLQSIVPPEMELKRFTLASRFEMIPPPKWKKDSPPTPGLRYTMRIEGRVISAFAETVVVEFLRTLKSGAGFGGLLESVKLERLHRDPTVSAGREARVFSVLLETVIRRMEPQEERAQHADEVKR